MEMAGDRGMRTARRRAWLLGSVIVLSLLIAGVADAAAGGAASAGPAISGNLAATRAYLHLEQRFLRAGIRALPAARKPMAAYVAELESRCAGVGRTGATVREHTGARRIAAWDAIGGEILDSVLLRLSESLQHVDGGRIGALLRARTEIHFPDRRIGALIAASRAEEEATHPASAQSLCAQLRSWAAGEYQAMPAGTRRFERRLAAARRRAIARVRTVYHHAPALDPGSLLDERLRRYEHGALKRLAHRIADLSSRFALRYLKIGSRAATRLDRRLRLRWMRTQASRYERAHHHGTHSRPVVASGPPPVGVKAPKAVRRAGGRELKEFRTGRHLAGQAGCEACHRIGSSGNHGPGPALTHIGSKLNGRQIHAALVRPKAPMPSFKAMGPRKLAALARFLSLLR